MRPIRDSPQATPARQAVILAGGTSRRWGGADKTAGDLAGRPLLQHALDAVLPWAGAVAVVAPADHAVRAAAEAAAHRAGRRLAWTREEPPGGGPGAGIAAGLAVLRPSEPVTLVVAGDLPFTGTAWPRLIEALGAGEHDAALGVDPGGNLQPLLAAYQTAALVRHLAGTDPADRPVRALLAGMAVLRVPVSAEESLDLDTPSDAERAGRRLRESSG